MNKMLLEYCKQKVKKKKVGRGYSGLSHAKNV